MIRSYINSIRNCGMVLKLERFSHLSGRPFALGSPIGLGYLSLMIHRELVHRGKGLPGEGSE